jgi:hypothetical protein
MIPQLDAALFDWLTWRAGDIWNDFNVICRTASLLTNADILRKYAVGWCQGENLVCRPKANEVAIMFFKDERYFWTHFRREEFAAIWNN